MKLQAQFIKSSITLGILGFVSASLIGCTPIKNKDEQTKTVELVQITKIQHVNKPRPAPYLRVTNNVDLGSMPIAYHPDQKLPAVFNTQVSYSLSQYDGLISLRTLVRQKNFISLNVKAPALNRIKRYFKQGGTLQYQGTLQNLLNQIAKKTGVFWKYSPEVNTVTYYFYQYCTINIPKNKIYGVRKIIGRNGYLLRKHDNTFQVFSTSSRLKQVYQYLSND